MRTWKLKPEWQEHFKFDSTDLANLFVNTTRLWYEVEDFFGLKQGLFGKADQVKQAIVDYLEKGENKTQDNDVIYALDKFQKEWLGEGEGATGIFHAPIQTSLKEFLKEQTWAVYRVDGFNRKFFVDTAFGPMWRIFPLEIEMPADLKLDTLGEVEQYLKE